MSNLKIFLGLLSMLYSASKELGLENLTKSDEQVLFVLWELFKKEKPPLKISYDSFLKASEGLGLVVSRAQFYKSLKSLEEQKIILRVGSDRSQTYDISVSLSS